MYTSQMESLYTLIRENLQDLQKNLTFNTVWYLLVRKLTIIGDVTKRFFTSGYLSYLGNLIVHVSSHKHRSERLDMDIVDVLSTMTAL